MPPAEGFLQVALLAVVVVVVVTCDMMLDLLLLPDETPRSDVNGVWSVPTPVRAVPFAVSACACDAVLRSTEESLQETKAALIYLR